jgi:hypothetical protein
MPNFKASTMGVPYNMAVTELYQKAVFIQGKLEVAIKAQRRISSSGQEV